jgi:polyisoprenoid-binding protein YceI
VEAHLGDTVKALRTVSLLAIACLSAQASADCWTSAPEGSSVAFTASQAGAALQGTFHAYDAHLCLDAGGGSLQVRVQTASVDTQLPELDEALRGADFFDVPHWPAAVFQSESIKPLGQGRYQLTGTLTIRDQTRRVALPFSWILQADGKGGRLEGAFSLKRLDYQIGQGQWADTRWVGDQVDLKFAVNFKPAAVRGGKG